MTRPSTILWLSDGHGQYIPQLFAKSFQDRAKNVEGVSDDDWAALDAGPDHSEYWDAWSDVIDNAIVTDDAGQTFRVYQDGDCWLVPIGMTWDEEADAWRWPHPLTTGANDND